MQARGHSRLRALFVSILANLVVVSPLPAEIIIYLKEMPYIDSLLILNCWHLADTILKRPHLEVSSPNSFMHPAWITCA